MSRLKNTKGFTDQFSEILNLSENQVMEIDDIEYNLYRAYYWDRSSPQPNFKYKFIRQIGMILSTEQWDRLKAFRNESKEKLRIQKQEKLIKLIDSEGTRLKSLALSDDELIKLAKLKLEIPNIIRAKRMSIPGVNRNIEKLRTEIEKEKISQILNPEQMVKYDEIISREKDKKLKWLIKLSSERFEYLVKIKLNEDQREGVYLIEDKSPSYNKEGKIFSEFEQADNKLQAYKQILDDEQMVIYQEYHKKLFKNIENRLIQSDEKRAVYLDRIKKYFKYYKKNILPKTSNARNEMEKFLSIQEKQKIERLKSEYFKVVKTNYNKSLDQFHRFTKNLAINEMKEHRFRHKLDLISPNGYYLKDSELAKDIMSSKLQKLLEIKYKELKSEYDNLKKYQIHVYEETGGEYGGGFLIKMCPRQEESIYANLGLLLLETTYENNLQKINAIEINR